MKELTSFSHGYGQLMGHIVLIPYRRKKIFKRDDIKFCTENVLRAIARKYKFEIIEMRVLEDHVHLFLSMKPTHDISSVIQCLKGISSKHLREMYPELKSYGSKLWSAGKFFRSVGSVTADTVEYYIKESQGKQKEHEASTKTGQKTQNPQTTLNQFNF
jgi:putative transposase